MKENKEEVYQHHIQVTDKAISVFKDSFTAENIDPSETYVRVGAKPGGCSGWKYELESNTPKDVGPNDIKILSQEVSVIVDREALTDILGSIRIDYSDKNLVEQGFVFEQLTNGHQCGCGESFTPVRDLKNG